ERSSFALGNNGFVERMNMLCDVGETIFRREVACCQTVHLGLRQVLQVGFSTLWREKDVSLSPEDDGLRLLLLEKLLPPGIQRDVVPVVIKQIQLQLTAMRPLQRLKVIHVPGIRTDQGRVGGAAQISSLD